jgi:hypothetical protein
MIDADFFLRWLEMRARWRKRVRRRLTLSMERVQQEPEMEQSDLTVSVRYFTVAIRANFVLSVGRKHFAAAIH